MRRILLLPLWMLLVQPLFAALPGLPETVDADGFSQRLGFAPGQRHPHHHELLAFYRQLAAESERVTIETIGRTHGGREQVLLVFARPDRLADVERLRAGRVAASRAGDGPPVIWLGYSVHGNEASGASAAALVAWYLATADDDQVRQWLDELVIVMEPVINPDGLDRFAHWVNMHRGRNPSADPNDREHNEAWPNGRTSYYWFDLNRDWLPLTHPASRNRIRHYRQWRPHVVTDAHEMGHRSSYFFQPGIPERNNPATPERVFELTAKIAEFHGRILDAAGEPYYSRESFDDYYIGKGSTYPDITGGIGILFEQGSSRGHRMDTPFGEREFNNAVANQVRTSISTLRAATALGDELIEHQRQFFAEAREGTRGGWLLGDDGDPARAHRLLATLLTHGIEIRPLEAAIKADEREFQPGRAWFIPADQDQRRFIEALFATPTELPMETFYDVSAWPLQHAFDLPLARVTRIPSTGQPLSDSALGASSAAVPENALAWRIGWRQHRAAAVLAALLADGYRVQVFQMPGRVDDIEIVRGDVLVHAGIQPDSLEPVGRRLQALAREHGVSVDVLTRGLATGGADLGSPSVPVLEAPRPLMLAGEGVSSYAAGYVWHWFDQHLDQPVTRVEALNLPGNLGDYRPIILPPGRYERLPSTVAEQLTEYVRDGGTLIALGSAATWVQSLDLGWRFIEAADSKANKDTEAGPERAAYADFEPDFARRLIGGSALAVELDITHPLAYGYTREGLTLFRQGAHRLRTSDNRYATPGRYTDSPLVAGYLGAETADKIAQTPALAADRLGRGTVIRIADDPLFRGYWAGAERLFANALLFSPLIEATRLPEDD
ncbi:MAG: M14 family zinc carboxypeptidase [Wenzhouxiangellaceae bacterium]|nr:M14 family zinc carboxypeptidase [Wenzhouxiangellaceae bacterium]